MGHSAYVSSLRAGIRSKTEADLDHGIRQIVSEAVASTEVIDIFEAAGLKKPDISILSDEFLAEVHELPQKNLAVDLLKKLLLGECKSRSGSSDEVPNVCIYTAKRRGLRRGSTTRSFLPRRGDKW